MVLQATILAVLSAPVFGRVFRAFFGPEFGTLAGWEEFAALVWLVSLSLCLLRHPQNPGHLASDLLLLIDIAGRAGQGPLVPVDAGRGAGAGQPDDFDEAGNARVDLTLADLNVV